jgi:hypothetical protein
VLVQGRRSRPCQGGRRDDARIPELRRQRLAAVSPANWLKLGIVAAALVDSVLVFSKLLEQPNATLNVAAPAAGLPQLQSVSFGTASMGYGDYFIAGVLGGLLLRERRRALPVAIGCLAIAACFDLLFLATDELPATVPIALALIASELAERRRGHARRERRGPGAHGARPDPAAATTGRDWRRIRAPRSPGEDSIGPF